MFPCVCVCVDTFLDISVLSVSPFLQIKFFLPLAAVSPPFAINNKLVNDIPTNNNGAKSICGFKSAIFHSVVSVGMWVGERMCLYMCQRVCISVCELVPKAIMLGVMLPNTAT